MLELGDRSEYNHKKLGKYINELGYHSQVHSPNDNTGPYIPMFVAAGLGQLGACG